ncbi:MAG: sulfatase-like hydrolase/transferase [Ignavibacteriaceae bacterium]|nr:sulfatase-like hydrolase/transferase [Ignavibacteriaceae bacterium]
MATTRNGKLLILFSSLQLALHSYYIISSRDPRIFLPGTIAFFHDLTILLLIYLINISVLSILRRNISAVDLIDKLFSILFIIAGAFLSAYPSLTREFLNYPVNLFEGDSGAASMLITEYLGISAFLVPGAALLAGIIITLHKKRITLPAKIVLPVVVIVFIISALSLRQASPQPLIYSIQNSLEMMMKNETRVVPSLVHSTKSTEMKIKTLEFPPKEMVEYDNILMIVLEGVTSADFEEEFTQINDGFFESNRTNIIHYNNYFATNLDSYTSLISMLTGVQVPYRAYADAESYSRVNEAPNLAMDMINRGYKNLFISTYQYQPFVPVSQNWSDIIDMLGINSDGEWLALGNNKMESATEDKAAIPYITDYIMKNEKVFLMAELVYGHSPEWRAKTGITQLRYYDSYLTEIKNKLDLAGELSKTLFVVVSDHGNRSLSASASNYRVPLFVYSPECQGGTNNDFLSHLELPEMIYHYSGAAEHPKARDEIFVVGSTEKWIFGKISSNGDYAFILDSRGTVVNRSGDISPAKIQKQFQEYLNSFNYKWGNMKK